MWRWWWRAPRPRCSSIEKEFHSDDVSGIGSENDATGMSVSGRVSNASKLFLIANFITRLQCVTVCP